MNLEFSHLEALRWLLGVGSCLWKGGCSWNEVLGSGCLASVSIPSPATGQKLMGRDILWVRFTPSSDLVSWGAWGSPEGPARRTNEPFCSSSRCHPRVFKMMTYFLKECFSFCFPSFELIFFIMKCFKDETRRERTIMSTYLPTTKLHPIRPYLYQTSCKGIQHYRYNGSSQCVPFPLPSSLLLRGDCSQESSVDHPSMA